MTVVSSLGAFFRPAKAQGAKKVVAVAGEVVSGLGKMRRVVKKEVLSGKEIDEILSGKRWHLADKAHIVDGMEDRVRDISCIRTRYSDGSFVEVYSNPFKKGSKMVVRCDKNGHVVKGAAIETHANGGPGTFASTKRLVDYEAEKSKEVCVSLGNWSTDVRTTYNNYLPGDKKIQIVRETRPFKSSDLVTHSLIDGPYESNPRILGSYSFKIPRYDSYEAIPYKKQKILLMG